jgi:hypothetical protein
MDKRAQEQASSQQQNPLESIHQLVLENRARLDVALRAQAHLLTEAGPLEDKDEAETALHEDVRRELERLRGGPGASVRQLADRSESE